MSYAQALFEVTQEQNLWHELPAQLAAVAQAVRQLPNLPAAFAQPGLSAAQKQQRINELFTHITGQPTHPVLMQLLGIMAEQHKLAKLPFIADQYQLLVDKTQRVLPAEVTTVVPMTDDQKRRLVDTLKQMTGMADIRLTCKVLPDILGGVVLKIQDLVVDGSTLGKLSQLRKQWC
jgi:F-type H+-transporting ATPase subunit delta